MRKPRKVHLDGTCFRLDGTCFRLMNSLIVSAIRACSSLEISTLPVGRILEPGPAMSFRLIGLSLNQPLLSAMT